MSQMPTFRFFFRVRERGYVLAFGPLCGWVLGTAPDGFEDQLEAKATRRDPGWERIILPSLPPDTILEPLAARAAEWDLSFPQINTSTEKRDDAPEREFVRQYAAEALQYVQAEHLWV